MCYLLKLKYKLIIIIPLTRAILVLLPVVEQANFIGSKSQELNNIKIRVIGNATPWETLFFKKETSESS